MNLPPEAATVRDTVAALLSNRDTPPPVHATTPALACYPEVRDATEYSRTAIRRLAEHLRRRYTLIVIDMSNRLPDPTAGPEAGVAAHWLPGGAPPPPPPPPRPPPGPRSAHLGPHAQPASRPDGGAGGGRGRLLARGGRRPRPAHHVGSGRLSPWPRLPRRARASPTP